MDHMQLFNSKTINVSYMYFIFCQQYVPLFQTKYICFTFEQSQFDLFNVVNITQHPGKGYFEVFYFVPSIKSKFSRQSFLFNQ